MVSCTSLLAGETMRTLSSSLETKIALEGSHRLTNSAVISNERVYWDSLYSNFPPSGVPTTGIQGTTMPQDVAYRSGDGLCYGLINDGGTVYGAKQGSSTKTNIITDATAGMRPSIWCTPAGQLWGFTIDSGGQLERWQLTTSFGKTLSGSTSFVGTSWGAIHAVSDTEVVILYTVNDEPGSVRASYYKYTGSWSYKHSSSYIMIPWRLWGQGGRTTELVDSGASYIEDGANKYIFVYISDRETGNIYGWCFSTRLNKWEDPFNVMPGDLSKFVITNAYHYSGTIYLACQFERTDDLANDDFASQPYSLFLQSVDGRNFSIPKSALVSQMGYNFMVAVSDTHVIGYAYNRIGRDERPGTQTLNVTNQDILLFDSSSGLGSASADLVLANADETFSNNALITEGAKVVVSSGYEGDQTVYGTYKIVSVNEGYADGLRNLSLELQHYGLESLRGFVHPFYTEIPARSNVQFTLTDSVEDEGEVFHAAMGGVYKSEIDIDFWFSEPYTGLTGSYTGIDIIEEGGPTFQKVGDTTTRYVRTEDFASQLVLLQSPTVIKNNYTGVISDIDVDIYATSRTLSAGQSSNAFSPRLIVENSEGVEREVTYSSMLNTPNSPPRTYYDNASGNYPMSFRFNGSSFYSGDKIKYAAIAIATPAANQTEWLLERITVKNVNAIYDDGRGGLGWIQLGESMVLENRVGRPFIMTASQPYQAQNFTAIAKVKITAPAEQTDAKAYFGITAFMLDAQNYFVARLYVNDQVNGKFQGVLVRDGKETVWAETTETSMSSFTSGWCYFMFSTIGGKLRIAWRTLTATEWTYAIDTSLMSGTQGKIAEDDTYMHLGFYGYEETPTVRIAGTYTNVGDKIGVLPGWKSGFDAMDDHGLLLIPFMGKHNYTGKDIGVSTYGNKTVGPFSARRSQTYKTNGTEEGSVDILFFNHDNASTVFETESAVFFDNGIGWDITSSLWNVDEGATHPLFRSRHYVTAPDVGNYLGQGTRSFIGHAFTGFQRYGGQDDSGDIPYGQFAFAYTGGKIEIEHFSVSSGETDMTLRDLIDKVSRMAGATPVFKDYTVASYSCGNGLGSYLRSTTDCSTQGFDVTFDLPYLANNQRILLVSNITGYVDGTTITCIGVEMISNYVYAVLTNASYTVQERIKIGEHTSGQVHNVRIVLAKDAVTFYWDHSWAHTYFFYNPTEGVEYSVTYDKKVTTLRFYNSGTSVNLANLRITELQKTREAIYFEMDATSDSAISSIIQERPVDIIPLYDGSVKFTYGTNLIANHAPSSRDLPSTILYTDNPSRGVSQAASDWIVYYEDVKAFRDPNYAAASGFHTRVLSLPDIENDEVSFMVYLMSKIFRENMARHQLSCRPDFHYEVGDVLGLSYTVSGINQAIDQGDIYIEGIMYNSQGEMVIEGRKYLAWDL